MALPALEDLTIPVPRTSQERLKLARDVYQRFHARCFWQSPRDLEITEDRIPFVIDGLRKNGGRDGFKLAEYLRSDAAEREPSGCR